jgi:hypothetical protein
MTEQRNGGGRVDIRKAFAEGTVIDQALKRAVAEAMRDHKRTGDPVAVWDWSEGRVVWLSATEIPDVDSNS